LPRSPCIFGGRNAVTRLNENSRANCPAILLKYPSKYPFLCKLLIFNSHCGGGRRWFFCAGVCRGWWIWGCNGAWGGFSAVVLLMSFARFCHVMTCFSTLFHLGVLASRSLSFALARWSSLSYVALQWAIVGVFLFEVFLGALKSLFKAHWLQY
jgi:hypothetical protein